MAKEKPLTLSDLAKYNNEVLFPAIGGIMDSKIEKLRNENLENFDKVFKDLEMLKEEKDVGKYQDERKRKFFGYMARHMETGSTSEKELKEIAKLNVL